MSAIKLAAIGINHSHIYGQVECLKRAGAEFVAFHAVEDDLAQAFGEKFPEARRVADRVRAGGAGGDHRMVGAFETEFD